MQENIMNVSKSLIYRLLPILIVALLFEGSYILLQPMIGNYNAYVTCTALPIVYLFFVSVLGYFNRVPFSFVLISQLCVIVCGLSNSYYILLHLAKTLPHPFTAVELLKWLMGDRWYYEILRFLVFGFAPIGLPIVSFRMMLKRPKSNIDLSKGRDHKTANSFGTASFCDKKTIKTLHDSKGIPVGCYLNKDVASFLEIKKAIGATKCKKSNMIKINAHHMTIVARTGAGKGVGFIVPTLLEYQGPVFVFDINHGENYSICQRRRRELGREVLALDPYEKFGAGGLKFNLLELLDPNDEEVVEDVMVYSKLLCPVVSTTENSHFDQFGAALIQCFILYVAFSAKFEGERNLYSVYKLVCMTQEELYGKKKDHNPQAIINEETENTSEASALGILHAISHDNTLVFGRASSIASKVLGATYREASSYFTTAFRELEFVDSPKMRRHLSKNELNINLLINGTADLFAILPSERISTQSRYMRLVTGAVFHLVQKAGGIRGQHDLLMVLDEFSLMGYMETLSKGIGFLRKYRIRFMGVAQDIETIREAYPKQWQRFLSTELLIFFGANGHDECELISKKLGQGTIDVESKNDGSSIQKRSFELINSSSSSQTGMSVSSSGRPLLFPDEVRRLGDEALIVLLVGHEPMILKRLTYYKCKFWQNKYDPNPFICGINYT